MNNVSIGNAEVGRLKNRTVVAETTLGQPPSACHTHYTVTPDATMMNSCEQPPPVGAMAPISSPFFAAAWYCLAGQQPRQVQPEASRNAFQRRAGAPSSVTATRVRSDTEASQVGRQ